MMLLGASCCSVPYIPTQIIFTFPNIPTYQNLYMFLEGEYYYLLNQKTRFSILICHEKVQQQQQKIFCSEIP